MGATLKMAAQEATVEHAIVAHATRVSTLTGYLKIPGAPNVVSFLIESAQQRRRRAHVAQESANLGCMDRQLRSDWLVAWLQGNKTMASLHLLSISPLQ